jgi:hypothetical protein
MPSEYARNQALAGEAAWPFFAVARKVLSNRLVRVKYLFFGLGRHLAGRVPFSARATPAPITDRVLRCKSSPRTIGTERRWVSRTR